MVDHQMTRHRCGLAVAILCGLTIAHVSAQSSQPIIVGAPSSPVATTLHVDLYGR